MKFNTTTILISLLILCVSILLSVQLIERFDNPETKEPLTYSDYSKLFNLASLATEIDKERVLIGLQKEPLSARIAPTPKDAIKKILDYVPNDRSKLNDIKKQIETNKYFLCKTDITALQNQVDTAPDKNNEYINNIKKQIEILKSPKAQKYIKLCSVNYKL